MGVEVKSKPRGGGEASRRWNESRWGEIVVKMDGGTEAEAAGPEDARKSRI